MLSVFRHAKFQAPLARLRSQLSGLWRLAYRAAGKYRPLTEAEKAVTPGDIAPFKGDIPLRGGDKPYQQRLLFAHPRPAFEEVDNLVVTPLGGAWHDGVLYEKYSACTPGLRMLAAAHKPKIEVANGFFIQSEHVDTFGDWTAEYLAPLARVEAIDAPVFLPSSLAARSYVKRDRERLGIDFRSIDAPVLIRKAKVVRQPKVIRYWRPEDAEALRRLMRAAPKDPAPGSLLYLSRHGEASLVANRTHPNLLVEEIVKARGGIVLRTGESDLQAYLDAGNQVETILFDHGSAAYNMIYWKPRRAIEFASDDWWMNAFLFMANAIGVKDYTIIRTDVAGVETRLNAALDAPFID